MSDNLKIQILKYINIEKFCQSLKVRYFRYIFVKVSSKTVQVISYALKMQDRLTFVALKKPRSLSLAFGYVYNPKFNSRI